jgi:alkanesulfonate monooxygenase SsuD/methylene tetrahydromethanopterin reductase-like flavin-dependent oxidoreductase (luciferase family)
VTAALGLALPLAGRGDDAAGFVAELVREVQAADEAGFELCLVPEHHGGPAASIVSPLTLCAALAAVTSSIRMGPGVIVLGVHDPLHVAEQVTMVDQLSGGRAVLGVGMGYQSSDFEPFGLDVADRRELFETRLERLSALLGSRRPPIWIGAWSAPGVRRAARVADGWIADPIRTVSEVAEMAALYRSFGGSGSVVVMREAWVGEPAEFEPVIDPVFRYYRRNGAAEIPADFGAYAADRFVMGAASECAAQVEEIAARTGADVVVLTLRQPGGPPHERVLESIRELGAVACRR